jgi:hypothetical protein
MAAEQCEIIRRARGVLASAFIDLGHVRVGSTNYIVYLHGRLQRLAGYSAELTTAVVNEMMGRIRHLPNVRGLKTDFEDWIESGGSWSPKGRAPVRARTRGSGLGRTLEVHVREDQVARDDTGTAPPLDIEGSRETDGR